MDGYTQPANQTPAIPVTPSQPNLGGVSPSSYFNDPSLQKAQDTYTGAQQNAIDVSSSAQTLPFLLRDALAKKFGTDNPQVQNRENAATDFFNSTTNAPASVLPSQNKGVIYSPGEQASLINQKESGALGRLGTANYLLNLVSGGMPNIINAASAGANAEATKAQGAADIAKTGYQNLFNLLKSKAETGLQERGQELQLAALNRQFQLNPEYQRGVALQSMTDEAKGGTTFEDMLQKYGTNPYITPQDVLNTYNAANYYGRPAEVTPQQVKEYKLQPGKTLLQNIGDFFSSNFGGRQSVSPTITMVNPRDGKSYSFSADQAQEARSRGWR